MYLRFERLTPMLINTEYFWGVTHWQLRNTPTLQRFLINDQRDALFFSMYLFTFLTLYMFRAHRAHHQEGQIVSIQPLVAVTVWRWPCRVQVGSEFTGSHQHFGTTYRSQLQGSSNPDCLTLGNGTDKLYLNVDNLAANLPCKHLRRAKTSFLLPRKPEISHCVNYLIFFTSNLL